jgi:hypothetical protein
LILFVAHHNYFKGTKPPAKVNDVGPWTTMINLQDPKGHLVALCYYMTILEHSKDTVTIASNPPSLYPHPITKDRESTTLLAPLCDSAAEHAGGF